MKRFAYALFLALACAVPAAAQQVATRTWVEADGTRWTEVTTTETGADAPHTPRLAARFAGLPRFGPFVVVDAARAALVDETDQRSPGLFKAMIKAFPGIRVLEMVDCPGTTDDIANLALGRLIRAQHITTEVPSGGSVRSGAVELFLAGAIRRAATDAEFGVHAWIDENGRQPDDFARDAPANRTYLEYYREMGLSAANASGLYALTNSVPNEQVLWLKPGDLRRYVSVE
jgi:hypothetical protein